MRACLSNSIAFDGIGAQLMHRLCVIVVANQSTPLCLARFTRVEHIENDWELHAWNTLLPQCSCIATRRIERKCVMKTPLVLYATAAREMRKKVIAWTRNISTHSPTTCVHMRRGDVTASWHNRWIPAEAYKRYAEGHRGTNIVHTELNRSEASRLHIDWHRASPPSRWTIKSHRPVSEVVSDCVTARYFVGSGTSTLSILIALLRTHLPVTLLCRHRALLPSPPVHWKLHTIA